MPKNQQYQVSLDDLPSRSTISVEQAAFLLGISRQGAYNAVDNGEIEAIRVGRRVRVLARPLYLRLAGGVLVGSDKQ